jgi:aspartate/methionine/tyrosine aminotransferase
MTEIEALKPGLDKKYQEYQQYIKQREEMVQAQIQAQVQAAQAMDMYRQHNESQHRHEANRAIKERRDLEWACVQPAPGWSLAKALEGVPGLNAPQATQHRHAYQQDYNSTVGLSEVILRSWRVNGRNPSVHQAWN